MPKAKHDSCYRKVKATYAVFPSARASQAIAKCRKKTSRSTRRKSSLVRWKQEKWKDMITNKPCGQGGDVEYCRPTRRISSKTPVTAGEMTKTQIAKKIREKLRIGKGKRVKSVNKNKK